MSTNGYQKFIKHVESIIFMFENAPVDNGWISDSYAEGILARSEAAILKICGERSPYTARTTAILESVYSATPRKAELIIGILRALKSDLEDGYLHSFSELVRAELFEDFIEMAEHLVHEGFKDPAAVIAGSSLESHLRNLCSKHGISVTIAATDGTSKPKKTNLLNQELGKTAYSLLDQKQITTWLHLRNDAAHGNYAAYSADEVIRMIQWVRDFIAKNPA